jgi:hypothetical protein
MLPLTLNDHIVHGHICIHDRPHLIFPSGKCRLPDNSESSLKHTKCTLNILPAETNNFYLIAQRLRLSSQMLLILDRSHPPNSIICCTHGHRSQSSLEEHGLQLAGRTYSSTAAH